MDIYFAKHCTRCFYTFSYQILPTIVQFWQKKLNLETLNLIKFLLSVGGRVVWESVIQLSRQTPPLKWFKCHWGQPLGQRGFKRKPWEGLERMNITLTGRYWAVRRGEVGREIQSRGETFQKAQWPEDTWCGHGTASCCRHGRIGCCMSACDGLGGQMRYNQQAIRKQQRVLTRRMAGSGLGFKRYFQQSSTNMWQSGQKERVEAGGWWRLSWSLGQD